MQREEVPLRTSDGRRVLSPGNRFSLGQGFLP